MSGVEIFCFDKGLISDFEIWRQSSTSIGSGALVTLLGSRHFGVEEGVEFCKISHIGVSMFQRQAPQKRPFAHCSQSSIAAYSGSLQLVPKESCNFIWVEKVSV